MTNDQIYADLGEIFDDVFEYVGALTPEMVAADVPGWDSMGHIRLVLAIEQKYGLRFQPAEVVNLKSLGELVKLTLAKAG